MTARWAFVTGRVLTLACVCACDEPTSSPSPGPRCVPGEGGGLRSLNRLEYDRTVGDLLGVDVELAGAFVPELRVDGFDTHEEASPPSALRVEQALAAAERVAEHVVGRLPDFVPCAAVEAMSTSDAQRCGSEFVAQFVRRAFRRPLTDELAQSYLDTYAQGAERGGFEVGVEWVVERALQSPRFLYRLEIGEGAFRTEEWIRLDGWAVASRLSYLLWRTMPDAELFEAAAAGALDDLAGVRTQVRRMIVDPRSRAGVLDFYTQWLGLDALPQTRKSPALFPEFTPAMVESMARETSLFIENVVWGPAGDLTTLLTASHSFVDARTASIYGLEVTPSADVERVDLDPSGRAGVLTHPSVMSVHSKADRSSPVLRGKFVRERLLCDSVGPPPPGLNTELSPSPSDSTLRGRFEAHTASPECAGCHRLMDPIGFGFEGLDAIGRQRTGRESSEGSARGEIHQGEETLEFDGVPDLARLLARRDEVRDCMVVQWFRYTMGRRETEADRCALDRLQARFAEVQGRILPLLEAIAVSDAFLYRPAMGSAQ